MSGGLNFEVGFNTNTTKLLEDDIPMRVYFLGDFTGEESAAKHNSTHSITKIDIDNFDDVMVRLSPTVNLASGQQLTFNELEDFHPDNLFEHPIFKNLQRLKRELKNSSTANNAAEEILSRYQLPIQTDIKNTTDSNNSSDDVIENKDEMFERLLGQKQSSDTTSVKTKTTTSHAEIANLDKFLSDLLNPHIIKDTKPEHQNLILFIDTAIEELMKSIIHSNKFQTLESAWRSVRNVIFNEAYDEAIQSFYLVNTDRHSLTLAADNDTSFLAKLGHHLKSVDGETYDVLVGNYQFSDANEDITILNYLASLAESYKCQLVCGANNSLINASEDSLWNQFRQTPQAKYVALSYPRTLLRLPYGKEQEEIDSFTFEELSQPHQHKDLLWGSSAFNCAQLLIRQYHSSNNRQGNLDTHINELPAFVYSDDDEKKLHPCGEVILSEPQLIQIRSQGIMTFASYRNKNAIRLFSNEIKAVNV